MKYMKGKCDLKKREFPMDHKLYEKIGKPKWQEAFMSYLIHMNLGYRTFNCLIMRVLNSYLTPELKNLVKTYLV
jgi:hypothetical protein